MVLKDVVISNVNSSGFWICRFKIKPIMSRAFDGDASDIASSIVCSCQQVGIASANWKIETIRSRFANRKWGRCVLRGAGLISCRFFLKLTRHNLVFIPTLYTQTQTQIQTQPQQQQQTKKHAMVKPAEMPARPFHFSSLRSNWWNLWELSEKRGGEIQR